MLKVIMKCDNETCKHGSDMEYDVECYEHRVGMYSFWPGEQ